MIQEINFGAISGKEIFRHEFEDLLIDWISSIEKQIALNPWSSFAPPFSSSNIPIGNRIVENIFELVGWNNFNKNEIIQLFDNHIGEEVDYNLSYRGEIESGLIDNTDDFIMIDVEHDISYPDDPKEAINYHIEKTSLFSKSFKDQNKIPVRRNEQTKIYSVLFMLSSNNNELKEDFIYLLCEVFLLCEVSRLRTVPNPSTSFNTKIKENIFIQL